MKTSSIPAASSKGKGRSLRMLTETRRSVKECTSQILNEYQGSEFDFTNSPTTDQYT